MDISISLIGAFILDTLIGDPQCSFHPVRGIGKAAEKAENILGRNRRNRITGATAWFLVVSVTALPPFILLYIAGTINQTVYYVLSGFIIYISFALRDLNYHGYCVYRALKHKDIAEARKRLSFMVSRNTDAMDEKEIIKTTIESLAENLSDSVIAPLFYTALFGAYGAWIYRIINTLDAMWGYKTREYQDFGFFAAKADDIINFIPARITALLITLISLLPGFSFAGAVTTIKKDATKHHSPNSGFPEAAAAGALKVGFGGPADYFGTIRNNPAIGSGKARLSDIPKMILLNSLSSISLIGFIYLIQGVIMP